MPSENRKKEESQVVLLEGRNGKCKKEKKNRERMVVIRESVGRETASSNNSTIWKRVERLG